MRPIERPDEGRKNTMAKTALYFSPQPTRAARARWAFLEAGVDFDAHSMDVFKGEHRTPEYLALNPLGLVPTASYDGDAIIESSALTWIAANEHPEAGLVPELGTAAWRSAVQWTLFGAAELDRLLAIMTQHTRFREPSKRDPKAVEAAVEAFGKRARFVAAALADKPFLLGDTFSVADICIGHALVWANMIDQLGAFPTLMAYIGRLSSRPALQQVYGKELPIFPDPHG